MNTVTHNSLLEHLLGNQIENPCHSDYYSISEYKILCAKVVNCEGGGCLLAGACIIIYVEKYISIPVNFPTCRVDHLFINRELKML